MDVEPLIQSVHEADVNKNQQEEDIYGAILGKPKPELETAKADVIQLLPEQDAKPIRNQEPNP
jgi:hypothetical protein